MSPTITTGGSSIEGSTNPLKPVKSAGSRHITISSADKTRHPWESRKCLSESYDQPVSGREGWWRTHIRETPGPGAYESDTFIAEIDRRPHTYRFKGDGRKIDPHPHGKGSVLLPGAYEHQDFLYKLDKNPATYNFKGIKRDPKFLTFGKKDKDVNVSPDAYAVERYLTLSVDKQPSKHFMFKSQAKRFPTIYFKPKEGPAPGNYAQEYQPPRSAHIISSSFRSKTPRFSTSHTQKRVPGPGSYEKTFQYPMSGTLSRMGRQHGLFFSSAFQA